MYKIIGLTGGIASGKTTVSDYLKERGYTVLDADAYSRKTTAKNGPAIPAIIEAFGKDIIDNNGELDRKKLGSIIFNDAGKRRELNEIVHPLIREMMNADEQKFIKEGHVFLDIPLLFENGLDERCDLVVTVFVDRDTQVKRLIKRNDLTAGEAEARINSQMPLTEKVQKSDCHLDNNGTVEELYEQLDRFTEELESL
ncbi:dephospho-CoA kinase [Jeotgalicoccus coquinae]|uniref:Dephospho-CoA kinase n=1 Tax=Jeotgalicoccus coquinae TaxID=709509 RepID=A0A6V7R9C1_9STAP|nr:dephospho-CoA kinase [Jeotgalicoccus coquinae]MBB6423114.1 dephospho-CoA kinase [Jeotgalicoccus coquinae]GGE10516.1 dephospho-CoA kinase [Jeotgalicoccus coquinae]CAD2073422.1 Dephospho-CoA kinase [Jeotgalicoccus coquinae]